MPNISSAKKRFRQSEVRRTRNRAAKSTLKTLVRKVLASVQAGDIDASQANFRELSKRLDQAAAKRVIHRNRAARVKSRISARIKALKGK